MCIYGKKQGGIGYILWKSVKAVKEDVFSGLLLESCNYSIDGIVSGCLDATSCTSEL